MPQGAAKVTRRAIRRAFGAEAVDVLNTHGDVLATLTAQVGALEVLTQQTSTAHDGLRDAHHAHVEAVDRFRQMSLRRRLRWLCLGR